jgi:hypothetical protein
MTSTDRNFASTSEVQLLRLEAGRHNTHPVRAGDVFRFFFGRGLRGFLRCFTGGGLKKAGYQAARGFLLPPVFRQTCVISASFQLYRCQYHFICELKSVSRSFLARDLCVCLKIWGISQNIQQFCFLNYSNYGMGFHDFAPWEISFPLKKTERLQVLSGLPGDPLSAAPRMRRRWGVPTLAPRISVAPYGEAGVDQPLNMGKF